MAEHANVVRMARFRPASGRREELVDRLQSGVDAIRQRDGCFGAQICTVREDPDVVVVLSRWANQAALDQFLSETTAQRSEAAALTREPPTTETFVST
jgi:quinol monooxygenase YgiN